jgi:hypothetical protein
MARRAKLLNQLAHLQLLQRCAVSCRRGRALVGIIADALRKSEVPTPPTAAAVAATVYSASTKQGLVSPLSNYSRSLTRSLGSPQTDHGRPDNKQPTPQDARPPALANAGSHTFRCEAYSDKGKCQCNRCVGQTRGGYLSRDACDAQMMSLSLGGDPSEPLLSVRRRWSWGTSRSVRRTDPLRHSRLT